MTVKELLVDEQRARDSLAILRGARGLLDRPDKWCQFQARIGVRRCMSRAIMDTAFLMNGLGDKSYYNATVLVAKALIRDGISPSSHCIITFNDTPGRRHSEILKVLDRAIAIAEAAVAEFDTAPAPVEEKVVVGV